MRKYLLEAKYQLDQSPLSFTGQELASLVSLAEPLRPSVNWFDDVRRRIVKWSAVWGGVLNWEDTLNILFERVLKEGEQATRYFTRQLVDRVRVGKCLVLQLEGWEETYRPIVNPSCCSGNINESN